LLCVPRNQGRIESRAKGPPTTRLNDYCRYIFVKQPILFQDEPNNLSGGNNLILSMNAEIQESFELREGIMVFIDFLGYRIFIKNNEPNITDPPKIKEEKLKRLERCVYSFNEQFKHHGKFWRLDYPKYSEINANSNAISYSDNLSIFIQPSDNNITETEKCSIITTIINQLAWTQYELAVDRWNYKPGLFLMDGGVTFGYGFMNNWLVAGPAHLRAYEISANTPYPRIEIDQIIIDKFSDCFVGTDFLIKDEMGHYFINYLIKSSDYPDCEIDELRKLSDFIKNNLDPKHSGPKKMDARIYKKYLWSAAYFNYYISEWGKSIDPIPYNIDQILYEQIQFEKTEEFKNPIFFRY
jgi:hypothetical protein